MRTRVRSRWQRTIAYDYDVTDFPGDNATSDENAAWASLELRTAAPCWNLAGQGLPRKAPKDMDYFNPQYAHFLDEFKRQRRWLLRRSEARHGGKCTKVPYCARDGPASSADPETWCSYLPDCEHLHTAACGLEYEE